MGFDISYGGAALAGILSFLSPCILPMVPFYLCYMAGLSMQELRGGGTIAAGAQRRLLICSIGFALGVTTIFVLLGLSVTMVGHLFAEWKGVLAWVAAAILFVFGLHFLGVVKVPLLYREARIEAKTEPSTVFGAYVMGLAFGFGWTPCVGPALAAILAIAAGAGDLWKGGTLLLVYGLAMTIPFVVAALFARPFLAWVGRHRAALGYVEKAMGAMLILFAVLIATDSINWISAFLVDNFNWETTLK